MTVEELVADIKATVARGNTLDSVIPTRVGWALRKLERNKSYRYMRLFGQSDLPAGAVRIDLPTTNVKAIRWVRVVTSSGRYVYIPRASDLRRAHRLTGDHHGYTYTHVRDHVRLSQPFSNDTTVEVSWLQFSPMVLPSVSEPTLLREAPELVHAETIIQLAPRIRSPRMIQEYKLVRDEALLTSMVAEDEAEWNDRSLKMGPAYFKPQVDEAVEYPLVPLGSELHSPSAEQVEASTDAWAPFGLYVFGGGDMPPAEESWEIT